MSIYLVENSIQILLFFRNRKKETPHKNGVFRKI